MCFSFLLLWSSIAMQNVQFTHIVPHRHVLKLTAKKVTGKKLLAIESVKGHYADWLFAAKCITLNTPEHVVQLNKMSMDCVNPRVQIHAQSGTFDLKTYNVVIHSASLTHRNMIFICPRANYDHNRQKITCRQGVMKNTHV